MTEEIKGVDFGELFRILDRHFAANPQMTEEEMWDTINEMYDDFADEFGEDESAEFDAIIDRIAEKYHLSFPEEVDPEDFEEIAAEPERLKKLLPVAKPDPALNEYGYIKEEADRIIEATQKKAREESEQLWAQRRLERERERESERESERDLVEKVRFLTKKIKDLEDADLLSEASRHVGGERLYRQSELARAALHISEEDEEYALEQLVQARKDLQLLKRQERVRKNYEFLPRYTPQELAAAVSEEALFHGDDGGKCAGGCGAWVRDPLEKPFCTECWPTYKDVYLQNRIR